MIAERDQTRVEKKRNKREIAHRIRRPVLLPDWVPTQGMGYLTRYGGCGPWDRPLPGWGTEKGTPGTRPDLLPLMSARRSEGHPMSERQYARIRSRCSSPARDHRARDLTGLISRSQPRIAPAGSGGGRVERPSSELSDCRTLTIPEGVVNQSGDSTPSYSFGAGGGRRDPYDWAGPCGRHDPFRLSVVLHRDARFYPIHSLRPLPLAPTFEETCRAAISVGSGPRMCIGREFARMEWCSLGRRARSGRLAWGGGAAWHAEHHAARRGVARSCAGLPLA